MGLNDNKSPWAKEGSVDTTAAPSLDSIVNRRFATQYLAERLPLPYGIVRELRDRVGKKIDIARKNGKLNSTSSGYRFGDFVVWAKTRKDFALAVTDVLIPATGSATTTFQGPTVKAFSYSLPDSLSDSHIALADAYRELNTVREENLTLRAAVAELTPYKHKAIARSEIARRAAKR